MEPSTDRPDDAELIDTAFAELFDRHAVAVHRYLARRIGPTIADDLLAQTLYQVAKTIPGIELIGSLANYDGTKGIAVGRVDTFHVEHDLIFTDDGSTYLGDRTIARAPSVEFDVPAGTLLGATAVTVDVTGKPELPN